jgi:hypothetical protein
MIKYRLSCKNCKLIFDSWFATSKEYDKLKKKKLLNCYNCNSLKVEKTLMAPKLINKNFNNSNNKKLQKYKNTIKKYQEFIKKNFEYVGENFSQKARSIHYNDNKKKKGIYGTASKKDLDELKEEGIDTQIIPWIEDKDN